MFVAVMETGSFTAAAERLGTSSGQASKLVSRLENELGVRLLSRTTRAVSPTEAGHAYFDRLRPLLEEFDNLDAAVRDKSGAPRGRLRLTVPLTFGTTEIAPGLNKFASKFPEIELDVSFSDRMVNLVDEGFDMAIRVGRADDSSMIARKLCDVRIVIVGSQCRGTGARGGVASQLAGAGVQELDLRVLQHAAVTPGIAREIHGLGCCSSVVPSGQQAGQLAVWAAFHRAGDRAAGGTCDQQRGPKVLHE